MPSHKPAQESHSFLYIICIIGFIVLNTTAILMIILSDLKYFPIEDTTKWWDITKVSFGAIMGYLFAGNTDKRNIKTVNS